ncbi:hypothetical protein EDWATA_03141 [Edwardsiella tarda ATCC 23685]|uniref:Uncharacterized protein n=1 Tax=Edwardsiella tarda ATCC 23685 TaxID=500638 RepID=D4F8P1_EDWTA|nr:hypothetical protein EDWATA_03141 [Edwardsiella tarda ATCC 23685]BEH71617.1 hypothetical protein GBS0709_07340 [Edwardsiella tarda]
MLKIIKQTRNQKITPFIDHASTYPSRDKEIKWIASTSRGVAHASLAVSVASLAFPTDNSAAGNRWPAIFPT